MAGAPGILETDDGDWIIHRPIVSGWIDVPAPGTQNRARRGVAPSVVAVMTSPPCAALRCNGNRPRRLRARPSPCRRRFVIRNPRLPCHKASARRLSRPLSLFRDSYANHWQCLVMGWLRAGGDRRAAGRSGADAPRRRPQGHFQGSHLVEHRLVAAGRWRGLPRFAEDTEG
ncbi:hypothetical protein XOCgx_4940 [Xanthomonas oryzae pv. oryzicola]|nr:hypothetical protein XOCgx_4940 [Xanthomonas oryzae pv. oryzicola]